MSKYGCLMNLPGQDARVGYFNPRTRLNKIAYHADGSVEWVELRQMIATYRRSMNRSRRPPMLMNPVQSLSSSSSSSSSTLFDPLMQPGGELPLAVLLPSIRQNPPERIDAAVEFQGIDVNANVDKTMGEDTNSVTQQPEKRPAKRQRNSIALSADDNEEISVPEKFAVGLPNFCDVKSFLANVVYVPGRGIWINISST